MLASSGVESVMGCDRQFEWVAIAIVGYGKIKRITQNNKYFNHNRATQKKLNDFFN